MTKEEIRNYVEGFVEFEYSEFGLVREEVISGLYYGAIFDFKRGKISEEDMIGIIEYIGYSISEEELVEIRADKEKLRIAREKRKAYNERRKEKKRLEREQKKLQKKVNK